MPLSSSKGRLAPPSPSRHLESHGDCNSTHCLSNARNELAPDIISRVCLRAWASSSMQYRALLALGVVADESWDNWAQNSCCRSKSMLPSQLLLFINLIRIMNSFFGTEMLWTLESTETDGSSRMGWPAEWKDIENTAERKRNMLKSNDENGFESLVSIRRAHPMSWVICDPLERSDHHCLRALDAANKNSRLCETAS